MTNGKLTVAGLTLGALGIFSVSARADEVDDYTRKLIDLDQRVHVMTLEFKDGSPNAPDAADRRVLDAQVLFSLKNYEEAATILFDVVEKWPNSRAYDDALFLLGESLYQARDFYSSRHYFTTFTKKNTGSKREQEALQRLVEISLRTGDYEHVEEYLSRLSKIPVQNLEPAVPYVRAKYYYFRGKLDDAMAGFNTVQAGNPYYFQARYFIATIMVKNGDLAGASVTYDSILKLQPPDDSAKEIQDLSRLAIGRILYERSQFDRAVDAYQSVPRQSKYFTDALFEQAWTFIKAKQWQRAYRALDLLLLTNPDSTQAPELRLLMGNLHLRLSNFYLASDAFSRTRDEFEPVHRQLQAVIVRSQTDPTFFDSLVGKSLDKFDISVFIPPAAAKWVKAEPDVARMLGLASDVGEMQRALTDSVKLVEKIERAMESRGRAGIFPDLAAKRTQSVEILNQLVEARQRFGGKIRAILEPTLSPDERKNLDHIAVERDGLERQLTNLPLTQDAMKTREGKIKDLYTGLESRASELNVEIQSLEAQLVAIEQYYRSSRAEQKIRPEDIQGPVRDVRASLDELRGLHDRIRDEIVDARRESATAGAAGEAERASTARLSELLKQEQEIHNRAKHRLSASDQEKVDRMGGVLSRADAIEKQLIAFDKRVDDQVDVRLETVKRYLATEKEQLASANSKLGGVVNESQSLGGGLAQAMFTRVADRFYDLVVRSDVGIIDVSWGLKDQKTSAVTKLTNQKNLELKALDEDFKKVMEEDK
jgi:tetratricopeptide (TPR) repeat protein